MQIANRWNIREEDGQFLQMVNRTNNAIEVYNRRFNSIFLKTPLLIEFNELVNNESLRQKDILNDIHAGRRCEKDCPEVWIPEIPLSYYQFKRKQEYAAEHLEREYATTDPEESSDDNIPINRKIAKPCSNIKKVARIIHMESKRAKKVSVAKSVKKKQKTKRPAAEPPTKRPAAQFRKSGFVWVLIIKARYSLLQILHKNYRIYVGLWYEHLLSSLLVIW